MRFLKILLIIFAVLVVGINAQTTKKKVTPAPKSKKTKSKLPADVSKVKPAMIFIEGGIFSMGSDSSAADEKPVHSVTLNNFYIGKYEVTQKEWIDVMGNHDEMLRKFEGLRMGSLNIVNKVVLDLPGGKKAWVFHGDVFDVTMQHSKWLAKLGAVGYDTLILINRFANFFSEKVFNNGKLSLSKKIKESVKSAVSFINNFEQTSADIGISNKFDYVVCGHIHHPEIKVITNQEGSITYLNSGDWVENLSALEFVDGKWSVYRFKESDNDEMALNFENEEDELNVNLLFDNMLHEFNMMRQ